MKTIVFSENNRNDGILHIELPGCIVNVHVGLTSDQGEKVTSVTIISDQYTGQEWDIDARPLAPTAKSIGIRVVERKH